MRRVDASFRRNCSRRRFGAVLALVALLVQLALPGAAALAMSDDPLRHTPICTGAGSSDHGQDPQSRQKALHAACLLCQAPAVATGFLPPPAPALAAPDRPILAVWRDSVRDLRPGTVGRSRARGPPTRA